MVFVGWGGDGGGVGERGVYLGGRGWGDWIVVGAGVGGSLVGVGVVILWVVWCVLVMFAIYEDGSVLEVCWRVDLMVRCWTIQPHDWASRRAGRYSAILENEAATSADMACLKFRDSCRTIERPASFSSITE